MNEVLRLSGLTRTFKQGRQRLHVLKGIELTVRAGEIVALVGPSGSGKTTLLQTASLLEPPDAGQIRICGHDCTRMNDAARTTIRRQHLGFVYQYHHLLAEFSALENIAIGQIIGGVSRRVARKRALEILSWLGLADRAKHRPARLSGGEQQRVAIGRAIATVPDLLLADEPTGNLDPATATDVFNVLLELARGSNLAAVIATHNPDLAARMDRIVRLDDGYLVENG
jgi:lipoprotein-releasing system ATP-binding protein